MEGQQQMINCENVAENSDGLLYDTIPASA
jgi:hypothetical protein